MQKKKSTRLKELFERPEIVVLAGGCTPFNAVMAEKAGYEAFYMSGGNTSVWLIGWPDVGLTSMREIVDNAHRIAKAVDIPVFSDADTGYGTAVNVYHTIQEFIWAGVAGIHLEDQEAPKKSGSQAGRRVISVEEAVGKYRAAMDAKKEMDPDFVVCARTDARGAEGGSLEEAVRRGQIYKKEAGVDVVFVEGLQTFDEVKVACREIPGPVFCLLHHPVIQPHPSLEEQQAAGMCAALYPRLTMIAGNQANWEFVNDFRERGVAALQDFWNSLEGKKWVYPSNNAEFLADRWQRIREIEEMYLPKQLRRDYEHTLGVRPT